MACISWFLHKQGRKRALHNIKQSLSKFCTLLRLPVIYWRKERITSSRHDPYRLGYTRVTMAITKGSHGENRSQTLKICLSTDCSLQLESMKKESLVIVDQHATVNQYLSLVLPARHALEVEWVGSHNFALFFPYFISFTN